MAKDTWQFSARSEAIDFPRIIREAALVQPDFDAIRIGRSDVDDGAPCTIVPAHKASRVRAPELDSLRLTLDGKQFIAFSGDVTEQAKTPLVRVKVEVF